MKKENFNGSIIRAARGEPVALSEQQRLADALQQTPALRKDLEVQKLLSRELDELRQAIQNIEAPDNSASVVAAAVAHAQSERRRFRWIRLASASGLAALVIMTVLGPMALDFDRPDLDAEVSGAQFRSVDDWPSYLEEFLPLGYDNAPSNTGIYTVIRVKIPFSTVAFVGDRTEEDWTIEADVILGEDGLARGIRFAEAEIGAAEN